MICKVCRKEGNSRSVISRGKIIEGCDNCISSQIKTDGHSAKFYREAQKKDFRRELTQPWEKGYAKAYPDKAREEWGDEAARKYS